MRRQKEPRCSVLPLSANQLRLDLGSFCLFLGVTNMVFEDLSGMKIGRWMVVRCTQRRSRGLPTKFLCVCECGEEREIQAGALKGGHSQSCGCWARDSASKRAKTHGMTKTCEYRIWQGVKDRVFDESCKDYKNYGGMGITLFREWVGDFTAFLAHVGPRPSPRHSLERIDNNLGYEPGNVKWATRVEQANNNRGNRVITINGERKTLAQWCAVFNRSYPTVNQRITQSEWDPVLALNTPTPRPFGGTNTRNWLQSDSKNYITGGD